MISFTFKTFKTTNRRSHNTAFWTEYKRNILPIFIHHNTQKTDILRFQNADILCIYFIVNVYDIRNIIIFPFCPDGIRKEITTKNLSFGVYICLLCPALAPPSHASLDYICTSKMSSRFHFIRNGPKIILMKSIVERTRITVYRFWEMAFWCSE